MESHRGQVTLASQAFLQAAWEFIEDCTEENPFHAVGYAIGGLACAANLFGGLSLTAAVCTIAAKVAGFDLLESSIDTLAEEALFANRSEDEASRWSGFIDFGTDAFFVDLSLYKVTTTLDPSSITPLSLKSADLALDGFAAWESPNEVEVTY